MILSFRYDKDYLSDMMYDHHFAAVSIGRKQDRNGGEDPSETPLRQGILRLQETKTGETAGKVAETANG